MIESTPLDGEGIASTSAPSVDNERMMLHEREIATLMERSTGLARRDELNSLKSEVFMEVTQRLERTDQKTASITRWAIGTICVAALTLTVAIIGATVSVYSAVSERSSQQVSVAATPLASIPSTNYPIQNYRVDIVLSIKGDTKQ